MTTETTTKRIPANAYNDLFLDGDDIVVIDFEDLETACELGVERNEFDLPELSVVYRGGCIVRNFPCVYVQDKHLADYTFENCGEVHLVNSSLRYSEIANARAIYCVDSVVSKTEFFEMTTERDGQALVTLVSSNLYQCDFRNIVVQTNGYLCRLFEDSEVNDCTHIDRYPDKEVMELYDCCD